MPPRPRVEPTDDWLPVLRLPAYAPRRERSSGAVQPPRFPLEQFGALVAVVDRSEPRFE